MKYVKPGLYILISLLGVPAIFGISCLGRAVPMQAQLGMYDSLSTIAVFVFGVMGAWLALVYPDTLKSILDPAVTKKEKLGRVIGRMLNPMVISLFIVVSSLLVKLAYLLGKYNFELQNYVEIIRGTSFAFLGVLFGLVVLALIYAISPGLGISDEFEIRINKDRRLKQLR